MRIVNLGDLAIVKPGYPLSERLHAIPKGAYRLLRMGDLTESGEVNWSNVARFNPPSGIQKYGVQDGDVVFQVRGTRNRAAFLTGTGGDVIAANHFCIITELREVLPEYLARYLRWNRVIARLLRGAEGSSTKVIRPDALASLPVLIPPLDVQGLLVQVEAKQWSEHVLQERRMELGRTYMDVLLLDYFRTHLDDRHDLP